MTEEPKSKNQTPEAPVSSPFNVDMLIQDILTKDEPYAQKKVKLEAVRILTERNNSTGNDKKDFWFKFGIVVPVIAAALTVIVSGILNLALENKKATIQEQLAEQQARIQQDLADQQSAIQRDLAKNQAELQADSAEQEAITQFELKAAEMVINSTTPLEAQNKATALSTLFPGRLSDFANTDFQASDYSGSGLSYSVRHELVQMIVEHPDQEQRIRELWKEFFGVDLTDPARRNPRDVGIVDFGQLAADLQQADEYYNELLAMPGFEDFANALTDNPYFQRLFIKNFVCSQLNSGALPDVIVAQLAQSVGLTVDDLADCPVQ